MPEDALLNDVNPHLINFYRWAAMGLDLGGIRAENDSDVYYSNRDRFNGLIRTGKADSRESAQLFYYLNRTGYNGLCRFNQSGEFNVPFGRYKSIPYADRFDEYRGTFKRWEFRYGDFEALQTQATDFIYADPPYDVEFRQYSKDGFQWQDQVRLAQWLANHPGPVVLSNQATQRIVELYVRLGFQLRYLMGPRRISNNGDRTPAREVLATKGVSG